jgi:hypothetical protein
MYRGFGDVLVVHAADSLFTQASATATKWHVASGKWPQKRWLWSSWNYRNVPICADGQVVDPPIAMQSNVEARIQSGKSCHRWPLATFTVALAMTCYTWLCQRCNHRQQR